MAVVCWLAFYRITVSEVTIVVLGVFHEIFGIGIGLILWMTWIQILVQ